ncbi:unnamed protein product, partial [Didymodactylos carnosus]
MLEIAVDHYANLFTEPEVIRPHPYHKFSTDSVSTQSSYDVLVPHDPKMPTTSNNGCESMNAIIKQKYTLRNKLHLSAFLPKMEEMLTDWSEASISSPFAAATSISPDTELHAYKWSVSINRSDILHWFNTFYVVPSSTATITSSVWLDLYPSGQWASFDDFAPWQTSCWLVSPLTSCTCPIGL